MCKQVPGEAVRYFQHILNLYMITKLVRLILLHAAYWLEPALGAYRWNSWMPLGTSSPACVCALIELYGQCR